MINRSSQKSNPSNMYASSESHTEKPRLHQTDFLYSSARDEPSRSGLVQQYSSVLKRTFDILVALPVVILVVPFFCVLVKVIHVLQSPGPLFYRQVRCGQNRQPFVIIKFRTMNMPRNGESEIAGNAESRIFALGHLLRTSKIDEFPQFLNVLRGEMSIVGPRPHHFDDCDMFSDQVKDYSLRTIVKPGITGLAQYTEYRGKFAWNCVESRVAADLKYIRRWSLWLDLAIVFKTIYAVALRFLPRPTGSRASGDLSTTSMLIRNVEPELTNESIAASDETQPSRRAA